MMNNKINTQILLITIMAFVVTACGKPVPDVDPSTIKFNLTVNPNSWVTVKAGKFYSGLNEHEKVINYDYKIMATEVTYKQYAKYLNDAMTAGKIKITDGDVHGFYRGDKFHNMKHEKHVKKGQQKYFSLKGLKCRIKFSNGKFSVIKGYNNFPAAYVTWFGADAYAKFYNLRLPSRLEWEKAARGTDKRSYPFKKEPEPSRANYYVSKDPFDRANGTTPVGFYNGKTHGNFKTIDSPSPFGCYDMAGNVAEWLGNVTKGTHLRLIYGGSMMEHAYNLRLYTENSSIPVYASFQVGFRCVENIPQKK